MSPDAAMTKMRLMALLMLGSKASGSPVAFTDIQAALDITPEQVRRVYFCSCAQVFGSVAVVLSWQREQELPAHSHASPFFYAAALGSVPRCKPSLLVLTLRGTPDLSAATWCTRCVLCLAPAGPALGGACHWQQAAGRPDRPGGCHGDHHTLPPPHLHQQRVAGPGPAAVQLARRSGVSQRHAGRKAGGPRALSAGRWCVLGACKGGGGGCRTAARNSRRSCAGCV